MTYLIILWFIIGCCAGGIVASIWYLIELNKLNQAIDDLEKRLEALLGDKSDEDDEHEENTSNEEEIKDMIDYAPEIDFDILEYLNDKYIGKTTDIIDQEDVV